MNEQSYKFNTIMMGILVLVVMMLGVSESFGQEPTPAPPAPKEVVDVQDVQPEGVQGVPKIAENFRSNERDLPDIGRVGVNMLIQKPIGLRDAIVRGLENNIDIEVTRQDVRIAGFDLSAADGSYEPRFTGRTFFERSTAPNISIFSSNKSTTLGTISGSARYDGFIRSTGTSYYGEFTNQRQTTNNQISILSPQNNAGLTFGFVQPLGLGRRFDDRRRVIAIAQKNLSMTDSQFRQKAIEITANVQRAYWDLTFNLKNLQVQRDGVRDAKEQLEHNKRLVNEGLLAPVDIIAAETQIANLELQVYAALENVNRAENFLKGLISGDRVDAIWSEALIPSDSVDLQIPRMSLDDALEIAISNRPELESLDVAGEINEINQRFYREQNKPQIDLTGSYTTSGVSGSFNSGFQTPFQPSQCQPDPTTPACQAAIIALNNMIRTSAESFSGGYQSTLTDLAINRYPTVRFGVTFTLPVAGGKTAQANLGKTLVQGEKIETQRRQLEQLIQIDVRNALQSMRTAEARLRSAAISRENSEKQYESEKRKLDSGLSDIYKVLERQTAFMTARSVEIQAQTELNKSIAELQRATGNSLKDNDVETKLRK